jgi:hypothetical protein
MLLLLSLSFTNLEIVISTEAAHGLIVSRAVEKSAVAVAFRLCVFFASQPQQISALGLGICRRIIHLTSSHKSRVRIPTSQSEAITGERNVQKQIKK